jgi:hypothetical protein
MTNFAEHTMKGNPRQPIERARATGQINRNPKRFRDRSGPDTTVPLGEPSDHMDDIQVCVWDAFKREISWLMESDRAAMEAACALRAKLWLGIAEAKDIAQLRILLSSFGATPADRTRIVSGADREPEDPMAKYVN